MEITEKKYKDVREIISKAIYSFTAKDTPGIYGYYSTMNEAIEGARLNVDILDDGDIVFVFEISTSSVDMDEGEGVGEKIIEDLFCDAWPGLVGSKDIYIEDRIYELV